MQHIFRKFCHFVANFNEFFLQKLPQIVNCNVMSGILKITQKIKSPGRCGGNIMFTFHLKSSDSVTKSQFKPKQAKTTKQNLSLKTCTRSKEIGVSRVEDI